MAAYAAGALVLAWIPVLGAFALLRPDSPYGNRHPERLRDHVLDHLCHSRGGLRARRVGCDLAHHRRGGFLGRSSGPLTPDQGARVGLSMCAEFASALCYPT